MDKSQADAIVKVILEPGLQAQEEFRLKRAKEALLLARQRQLALFSLIGCAVGGLAAYFMGAHFTRGIVWGATAGIVIALLVILLRGRSGAS